MTTFDQALPELLRICEASAGFGADVARACVVRDLEGRLRLALALASDRPSRTLDTQALTRALDGALDAYFVGPVLATDGSSEVRRLVTNLVKKSEPWPESWPTTIDHPFDGTTRTLDRDRWCVVNRVLSKEAWISRRARATPPWPLVASASAPPAIVSFYSFKGGVGRTTLLGLVARALASMGRRVAVVDLDLEAPGVASFLGVRQDRERGVLDFLVDHAVTKSVSIDGLHAPAFGLQGAAQNLVDVFPAGSMRPGYLEKLARLDFASTRSSADDASPSEVALRALLESIRRSLKPEYILIDSRAGLHDLGGLSLHSLSHVDVLVSRSGHQALEGLSITVRTLAARRDPAERRVVLVHSLVPADPEVGQRIHDAFREAAFELFEETLYEDLDDEVPSLDDDQGAHYAWPVPRYTELESADSIADVDVAVADGEPVRAIVQRILSTATLEGASA